MTLITYPTRVHFADNVLQDALHSELEQAGCKSPLLIFENKLTDGEFAERVLAGLPRKANAQTLSFAPRGDLSLVAQETMSTSENPDVIIAFGSARAIELGRKCRYGFTQKYRKRPPLYAIPGIDGLPNPCTRNIESWRAGLPSVLICDPTVTLDADQKQSVRASVLSIVRCVESYLANAYNPPADGMALDGLTRCVINLPKINDGVSLGLQRELMAACLNAALSQEKGLGPTLTLAAALSDEQSGLDQAEMARLLLPGVIKSLAVDSVKAGTLRKVLGTTDAKLGDAVHSVFEPVPMPASLSAIGVSTETLDVVAKRVDGKAGLDSKVARDVLEMVY